MALPSVSHTPSLATSSPTSSHSPAVAGVGSSPTTETPPAPPTVARFTTPSPPMPFPCRISRPTQIIHRMPTPCRAYSSFECFAYSPLRTVMHQDQVKPPQPAWKPFQRRRDIDRSAAREALSDASNWNSQVSLLPRRRSFGWSPTSPRRSAAADPTVAKPASVEPGATPDRA